MKTLTRGLCKLVCNGLMVAVALLPVQAMCQSANEPAVVVSIGAMNEQLNDLEYMANAAGEQMGQMSGIMKMQAMAFLNGIDLDKPAGAMLYFGDDSDEPSPVAYIPVKNLDDMLDTISRWADVEEDGKKFIIIPQGSEEEFLLKKEGDYAIISNDAELLAAAPKDPTKMLAEQSAKYNFAAKIYAQRIPEFLREQAIEMIRTSAESSMESFEDEDPIRAELQRKNFELQMAQMESLITETDELLIGFNANQDQEALQFDVTMTGKPGSEMAKRMAAAGDAGPSKFSGFLMKGSAFTANVASKLTTEDAANYKKMIADLKKNGLEEIESDENMSDEQVDLCKKLLTDFVAVLNQTLDKGRLDMGALVTTQEDELNVAMGIQVEDPRKLESSVKELVKVVEGDPDMKDKIEFNLNSGTHQNVDMHEITFAIPEDEEEARSIFGESVKAIIGFGKGEVYLAFGAQPDALLKKALDASVQSSANAEYSMQWNLYLAPVLRFASGIEGAEMAEIFAEKMEEVGKDRIRMTSNFVENGFNLRFELQDGILQLMSVAGEAMGGFGGADF